MTFLKKREDNKKRKHSKNDYSKAATASVTFLLRKMCLSWKVLTVVSSSSFANIFFTRVHSLSFSEQEDPGCVPVGSPVFYLPMPNSCLTFSVGEPNNCGSLHIVKALCL